MRIIDNIKISFISLLRQRVRTFLTTFAVFIGVFIIIFLVSLSYGAQDLILKQITNAFDVNAIYVLKKDSFSFSFINPKATTEKQENKRVINNEAIDEIKKIDSVKEVEPISQVIGNNLEFKDKNFDNRLIKGASGAGWNIKKDDKFIREILVGRVDNLKNNEIILTKQVVDAFGKNPEEFLDKIVILTDQGSFLGSQTKPLDPQEYVVVGVIDLKDNAQFILSINKVIADQAMKNRYTTVDEYLEIVGYQSLYVKTNNETEVKDVSAKIKELGFDAQTQQDIVNIFNNLFGIVPLIFSIVGIIAVIVASIGIINTMIMAVYERTKEIGVMKAVGATNFTILRLFIVEAGMIGFLGGLIAVIMSYIVMLIFQAAIIQVILPSLGVEGVTEIFITPPWLIIITIIFSTLVGILAGIYPAFRASRLDPVAALRYE